jgi:hypothetical protein
MKINEVINKQQVSEIAPLAAIGITAGAGALTWAVVMAAVDAYFIYDAGKEINAILSKYGYDTSKVSEDDWWEITIVVIATGVALAAPALGKMTKAAVIKYMPESIKTKAIELVKGKVIDKVAKDKPAVAKDPNKIDRPFSKDPSTTPAGTSGGGTAGTTKPATKNPNWVEKPYQKEEILRLAGLVK